MIIVNIITDTEVIANIVIIIRFVDLRNMIFLGKIYTHTNRNYAMNICNTHMWKNSCPRFGQEHVLTWWGDLSEEEQEELMK